MSSANSARGRRPIPITASGDATGLLQWIKDVGAAWDAAELAAPRVGSTARATRPARGGTRITSAGVKVQARRKNPVEKENVRPADASNWDSTTPHATTPAQSNSMSWGPPMRSITPSRTKLTRLALEALVADADFDMQRNNNGGTLPADDELTPTEIVSDAGDELKSLELLEHAPEGGAVKDAIPRVRFVAPGKSAEHVYHQAVNSDLPEEDQTASTPLSPISVASNASAGGGARPRPLVISGCVVPAPLQAWFEEWLRDPEAHKARMRGTASSDTTSTSSRSRKRKRRRTPVNQRQASELDEYKWRLVVEAEEEDRERERQRMGYYAAPIQRQTSDLDDYKWQLVEEEEEEERSRKRQRTGSDASA
ncbi:hypothetical protein C8R46DRAFT_1358674 [Mycena filopes]|nr:hypothetical protein C8R46DRAFT_1358674 [Mycena filopes]